MIGRKRNSIGVPRSTEGGIGAFTLLVGLIVLVVLAGAYSINSSDDGAGTAASGNPGAAVAAKGNGGAGSGAAQAARTRKRNAALVRAQRAVRRATLRRRAARRAQLQAARRRATVTYTVVRSVPAYRTSVQYLCAREPRGGSRAARRARRQRVNARQQTLRQLNLHC